MLKANRLLEEFENRCLRENPVDFEQNLKLVEAMLEEARMLGAFPPKNPLDGIEVDVRIAMVVNSVRPSN